MIESDLFKFDIGDFVSIREEKNIFNKCIVKTYEDKEREMTYSEYLTGKKCEFGFVPVNIYDKYGRESIKGVDIKRLKSYRDISDMFEIKYITSHYCKSTSDQMCNICRYERKIPDYMISPLFPDKGGKYDIKEFLVYEFEIEYAFTGNPIPI